MSTGLLETVGEVSGEKTETSKSAWIRPAERMPHTALVISIVSLLTQLLSDGSRYMFSN
jgi:hypothetical protein